MDFFTPTILETYRQMVSPSNSKFTNLGRLFGRDGITTLGRNQIFEKGTEASSLMNLTLANLREAVYIETKQNVIVMYFS